jgi:hypothetical protein
MDVEMASVLQGEDGARALRALVGGYPGGVGAAVQRTARLCEEAEAVVREGLSPASLRYIRNSLALLHALLGSVQGSVPDAARAALQVAMRVGDPGPFPAEIVTAAGSLTELALANLGTHHTQELDLALFDAWFPRLLLYEASPSTRGAALAHTYAVVLELLGRNRLVNTTMRALQEKNKDTKLANLLELLMVHVTREDLRVPALHLLLLVCLFNAHFRRVVAKSPKMPSMLRVLAGLVPQAIPDSDPAPRQVAVTTLVLKVLLVLMAHKTFAARAASVLLQKDGLDAFQIGFQHSQTDEEVIRAGLGFSLPGWLNAVLAANVTFRSEFSSVEAHVIALRLLRSVPVDHLRSELGQVRALAGELLYQCCLTIEVASAATQIETAQLEEITRHCVYFLGFCMDPALPKECIPAIHEALLCCKTPLEAIAARITASASTEAATLQGEAGQEMLMWEQQGGEEGLISEPEEVTQRRSLQANIKSLVEYAKNF